MRSRMTHAIVCLAVVLFASPGWAADAPPPIVLLMWDGSGSMLLTQDGNVVDSEATCLATPPRLHIAQQVFTGSIASPTCTQTPRTGSGIVPYWTNYAL